MSQRNRSEKTGLGGQMAAGVSHGMPSPAQQASGITGEISSNGVISSAQLAELRAALDNVTSEWAAFASNSANAATKATSEAIQKRPWTAIGIALVGGATLALLVAPSRSSGRRSHAHRDTKRRNRGAASEPAAFAQRVEHAVPQGQSLTERFTAAVDSLTNFDSKSLTNLPEPLGKWISSFWQRAN
ncbi:MAG: hypothetical protein SH859_11785 [Hyphomicrobium aestuarii]|nr:hypothetical protein [Hyphomicrobium aestuarii]